MNIQGAIFDFDGTLFDTMGIWEHAGTDYLTSLGIAPEPGLDEHLRPLSLMQSAAYLREHYGLPKSSEEIQQDFADLVADFYTNHAMPKEGVADLLNRLHSKGIPLCIATATDHDLVAAALKRCGLLQYFPRIFTCTEVGCGKDSPRIYEVAADYLGTARAETAVFEDAYHAAATAKEAGFPVIGIYDRFEPRTEQLKNLVNIYVRSFSELNI